MIQNKCKTKKIIGLTGGISTGKSTVSNIIQKRGIPVIDADIIAREVVQVGNPAYLDIVKEFGNSILNEDFSINRIKLGEIIFNNTESRMKLNRIVHPRVVKEMIKQANNRLDESNVVFLDIPLLIEERLVLEKMGLKVDEIWLVYVDEETQVNRLITRDNINTEIAYSKIISQMPIDEKKKFSDVIIDNSGNIEDLNKRVNELLKKVV